MRRFHPLVNLFVRADLRADGYSPLEIRRAMWRLNDEVLEKATSMAEKTCGQSAPSALTLTTMIDATGAPTEGVTTGAFGDGEFIKRLEEFFQTELGQLLLQILKSILMGLLVV